MECLLKEEVALTSVSMKSKKKKKNQEIWFCEPAKPMDNHIKKENEKEKKVSNFFNKNVKKVNN